MPRKVEKALAKSAKKKGYKGKRANQYIYATMNKLGLLDDEKDGASKSKPKKPSKKKGAADPKRRAKRKGGK